MTDPVSLITQGGNLITKYTTKVEIVITKLDGIKY